MCWSAINYQAGIVKCVGIFLQCAFVMKVDTVSYMYYITQLHVHVDSVPLSQKQILFLWRAIEKLYMLKAVDTVSNYSK